MHDSEASRTDGITLANEALHEAGHAVMARLLGRELGQIRIDLLEGVGTVCVVDVEASGLEGQLKVLAASKVCLNAFGISTVHEEGLFSDAVGANNLLNEMFPGDENKEGDQTGPG
jgi:hypothetical protein